MRDYNLKFEYLKVPSQQKGNLMGSSENSRPNQSARKFIANKISDSQSESTKYLIIWKACERKYSAPLLENKNM